MKPSERAIDPDVLSAKYREEQLLHLLTNSYFQVDRGLPFSTYALRGRGVLKKWLISAYDSTDRLREMRTRGREGVKNPENFAYELNGSPLT